MALIRSFDQTHILLKRCSFRVSELKLGASALISGFVMSVVVMTAVAFFGKACVVLQVIPDGFEVQERERERVKGALFQKCWKILAQTFCSSSLQNQQTITTNNTHALQSTNPIQ